MKKWLRKFLTASADELPPPESARSEQFAPGQVWRYTTRPGEEASRVVIGKIERCPNINIGTVVHVKLTDVQIKDPTRPGDFCRTITHAPVSEAVLSESVIELTNEVSDLDGFSEGYNTWLSSARAGDAGVFTLTLCEIVEAMEQTVNRGKPITEAR